MLTLSICGAVREAESGLGLPGLLVRAYDTERRFADLLGTTYTIEEGRFAIVCGPKDFGAFFDVRPELYLEVFALGAAKPLYITETPARWHGWHLEEFGVRIPRDRLGDLGLRLGLWLLGDDSPERDSFDVGEPLCANIRRSVFSVRRDFPDTWYDLANQPEAPMMVSIPLRPQSFPPHLSGVSIQEVSITVRLSNGQPAEYAARPAYLHHRVSLDRRSLYRLPWA